MNNRIPAPDLKFLLRYAEKTGRLYWIERSPSLFSDGATLSAEESCARFNKTWAGKEAFTSINSTGYRQGTIWTKRYSGHRVVWALVFGLWPPKSIDHINGIRSDNRLENLRLATHRQNLANMRRVKVLGSKFKGVSPSRQTNRWRAQIKVDGRYIHLGTFHDEEQAARAYDLAAREHFREFANPNFTQEVQP